MIGNTIARRYARALFAVGAKDLDVIKESLDFLRAALAVSPNLGQVLSSPLFSLDEKNGVLAKLGKSLSLNKTVLNFCYLLADKKRIDVLPAISSAFNALLDEKKNILRGELFTAVELTKDKQQSVLKDLTEKTGKELALEFGVTPDILGGVVLKVGDKVLDASLRAQLSILQDSIKRGE